MNQTGMHEEAHRLTLTKIKKKKKKERIKRGNKKESRKAINKPINENKH